MWPYRGINDEAIYRCLSHGWWATDTIEDDQENSTDLVVLVVYDWRT